MKTYIITFQSAKNYGAVLQAHALQCYLDYKYGNVSIIDYRNPNVEKNYSFPSLKNVLSNPQNALFRMIQSILYRGKYKKITEFKEKKMKLTIPCDSQSVKMITTDGDVFITGSDQVWNYLITGEDETYFLGFVTNKITCSYAASFGIAEIPQNHLVFYERGLKKISHISVRENQGKQILDTMGIKGVQVLCDPTLLLERSFWLKLCESPKNRGKYILVYKITTVDNLLDFARNLSQKTKLPVVYIPNDLKSGCIGSLKLNVGVEQWLGYIKNAEYVVTNSFHGTVFSILFGRKFFSEVSRKVNPSTSRLLTLLEMFHLKERIIADYKEFLLFKELDMLEIDRVLFQQRKMTEEFFQTVYKEVK